MTTYTQKITFGEMRASGVRDVLIYCRNGARHGLFRMDQAAMAYRLLAAFLILKSSIRLPEPNFTTSQRGCLPRPAQVSDG